MEWHHYVFGPVANLVQMRIENDETSIFQVVVDDDDGHNEYQPPETGGVVVGQTLMVILSCYSNILLHLFL